MRLFSASELRHACWLWDDAHAKPGSAAERVAYRASLLAADRRTRGAGGGSTSGKLQEHDLVTRKPVEVLWIGSQSPSRLARGAEGLASLVRERALCLCEPDTPTLLGAASGVTRDPRAAERLAELWAHCAFAGNRLAPPADTPLHALLPARHVDCLRAAAVLAIASSGHGRELTERVFSGDLCWLPWTRPGQERGLAVARLARSHPRLLGVVLAHAGVVTWAEDGAECYARSLAIVETAARFVARADRGSATFGGRRFDPLPESRRHAVLADVLPWLRTRIGERPMIAAVNDDAAMLAFTDSRDASRLLALAANVPAATARAHEWPLRVDWDPEAEDTPSLRAKLAEGLAGQRTPAAVLIPGLGMLAFGADERAARATAATLATVVEAMRGAEAIDAWVAPPEAALDGTVCAIGAGVEAGTETETRGAALARRVALVVGAGSGIGRAAALRLAREGAHVVCADLDADAARATAAAILATAGADRGVEPRGDAGTGAAVRGAAFACGVDVTRRESVRELVDRAVLAYGGIDHLVVTAGIYVAPDAHGRIADAEWRRTFDVNVLGAWLVVDECRRVFEAQGTPASIVLTTSANAVVAKKGSLAYDASKAAANHLVRELAIELAPHVRVNAVAPATVIAGSTMFPRERVIASLQKYGIAFEPSAETEALRERLATFYAERTLTKRSVLPEDQAEAILFLLSDASAKTTGQVLAVDGGLPEAFAR